MFHEHVKVPDGQQIVRVEEAMDGSAIAMARMNREMFAVYWVSPSGHVEDPTYGDFRTAAGQFEARLH